jgi:hypothetical protein
MRSPFRPAAKRPAYKLQSTLWRGTESLADAERENDRRVERLRSRAPALEQVTAQCAHQRQNEQTLCAVCVRTQERRQARRREARNPLRWEEAGRRLARQASVFRSAGQAVPFSVTSCTQGAAARWCWPFERPHLGQGLVTPSSSTCTTNMSLRNIGDV